MLERDIFYLLSIVTPPEKNLEVSCSDPLMFNIILAKEDLSFLCFLFLFYFFWPCEYESEKGTQNLNFSLETDYLFLRKVVISRAKSRCYLNILGYWRRNG